MIIRELGEQDIEAVVYLGQLNQEECFPKHLYDPNRVREYCLKGIGLPHFKVWTAWNTNEPVGYAVASCAPQFYCDALSSNLLLIYVKQENRGGSAFVRLVGAYEDWAKELGVEKITLGVDRSDTTAAKDIEKLFPKLGYKWAGANYVKEIV